MKSLRMRYLVVLLFLTVLLLETKPLFGLVRSQDVSPGSEYKSPNGIFSVKIPKPHNWAVVPYTLTVLDTKGDNRYDKVMLHVGDFGHYLVAGARFLPEQAVAMMDMDDHRTVLRNVSEGSLMGWRTDFSELPEVAEESFFDTPYGEGIMRVYRAKEGSVLALEKGGEQIQFDTNIAGIVVRQGSLVIFVLAQNDSNAGDAGVVKKMAIELFGDLKITGNK